MSQLLYTFSSSHTAMEAELLCEDAGHPCRLIPLPSMISAGCGLALLCPDAYGAAVNHLLTTHRLHLEGLYQGGGKTWEKVCHDLS
ncbi:MAG: DUF3343 domain-containing protein [Clostridiales bacterium]|nr:DUF3343 domain-containing protein [Clostridiales bacterium]